VSSTLSLSKVEPLINSEYLELITNPGSAKGSRNVSPAPLPGKEIQAFKPIENGLRKFSNESFIGMEKMNDIDGEGLSALHRAVRAGDVATVVALLDNGADINLLGKSGLTPLHAAVRFERAEIVKRLLERGADPLIEGENHLTPLHSAARRGFTEICRLLFRDPRLMPTAVKDERASPFHLACLSGNRETCELFLANGADVVTKSGQHTPLHFAAWQGNENICKFLIETASKGQFSVAEFVNEKDNEGKTALHYACFRGHTGVVDVLLRHEADRDVVDLLGCSSPLHLAAKYGNETSVQLLILYEAVIDLRDGSLRTPLHSAAAFNHNRIVELLLENGADPEAKDMLAMTPFLMAVTLGGSQSAKILLDHGADITATDSSLNSCLHLAIKYKRAEMVKMLLERDTDQMLILSKDKDLRSVFHLAAGLENSEILEILIQWRKQHDVKIDRDVNEKTPLHIAAENGALECVELLSSCKDMLNDRDELGLTALHLAASNKHTKTCEFLISKGSDVTFGDGNGCTALHLAVKAGSLNTVKILLDCLLPSTLEHKDSSQNTPLHVACMHNRRDVLKFLLDRGADVTARNIRNMTCLDVAIEWEAGEVAKTLLRHKRWEEVLKSSHGVYPMQKLIEKLPDVAEIVLDQCISYSPLPPSHEDFSVTFNFIHLDPDENTERLKYFGPATMAIHRREKLLNHKVTQVLLRWKWMILGKFVNIVNTIAFAVFVVLFSLLVAKEREKVEFSFNSSETTTIMEEKGKSTFVKIVPYVLTVFLVIQLMKEVTQLTWLRLSYFKDYTNWLDLAMFVTVWIFISPYMFETDLYSMKTQWTAGVVGLLLCYINFTMSLRIFGGFGLYVTMYVEVLFTLLKVMSTFVIGLTGFSLAFYILLQEQGNFTSFWLALAKIHMMMVGELDYTGVLVENVVNNFTVPGTDVPYVPLPALTFCLFFVFVVMVSVVLVNLLVGLAVGDIEAIRKTASLRALIDQVLLVDHILKSYPKFILRRIYKSSLEIKPNQNSFLKRVAFAGNDLSDWDFMDKLLNRGSGASDTEDWCQEMTQIRDERQEENFQKLQATVEAQGKLLQAMAEKLKITV